jgi:plasmid maintenance system antidote protein VapI
MTTISEITLQMFSKWRNLPHAIQNQIARTIGVHRNRIEGFFLNQNSITFEKVVELEKHLTNG